MNSFTFSYPTKVYFGEGSAAQAFRTELRKKGKTVLLAYGGGSVKKNGVYDEVKALLKQADKTIIDFSGIMPNPTYAKVQEGAAIAREQHVDFILAVGGGSVIDSSKAIGYGVENGGDVWDFYERKREATSCLPIGVVLTIAAAGSEMSNSSVITNENGWLKRGYGNDCCRARFAVMDPELTMTLPKYQTASGCVDIMMHTMERYFNQEENLDLTDGFSEHLIRTVMENAQILMKEPDNYKARAEVMWAGSLSHNGLTGCGTAGGDWASHQLEHELGGMFDVAHGAGLAAVWGSWARYVLDGNPARFAQFAVRVMGQTEGDDEKETALRGICAMEEFYRSVNMPTSLAELGIHPSDEELRELAEKCSHFGKRTVGCIKKLDQEDMYQIYKKAL